MGVADNKSYKNQYHFNNKYWDINSEGLPSVNGNPDINDTIKENPYKDRTNVEIEGQEVVLQPDLTALFKARGKKHYDGGMQVNLKPNSFIFSNDKSLALDKNDHEHLELKKGGNFNKTNNTPADVLKRNIDTKHYNTIVNNIQDVKKDDLAKKSSALMLDKYIKTLGNIAYAQEAKKGFPDGLPAFSQGTAPVYDAQLKENIDQQKQFAKYGGVINNPYAQKGGTQGGWDTDPCHFGTPCHQAKHPHLYSHRTQNRPAPLPLPSQVYGIPIQPTAAPVVGGIPTPAPIQAAIPDTITPGDVTGAPQAAKEINWQFTPWQKLSQGYEALKYASAHRYMPYRSQLNSSYITPNLVNPEQAVGDLKAGVNAQTDALNTLSPILRNAQASEMFGKYLDQAPQIRSQYDNQNVGITNQFKGVNNQIRNQQLGTNMQNDANYYQQSVTGRANFDNMKNYLGDQYMNNVMGDVQTNQALAYNLMTQKNPRYGFDWRTGNFSVNPKDIRDVEGSGVDENYNKMMEMIQQIPDPTERVKQLIKLQGLKVFGPAITNGTGKKGGRVNPYK